MHRFCRGWIENRHQERRDLNHLLDVIGPRWFILSLIGHWTTIAHLPFLLKTSLKICLTVPGPSCDLLQTNFGMWQLFQKQIADRESDVWSRSQGWSGQTSSLFRDLFKVSRIVFQRSFVCCTLPVARPGITNKAKEKADVENIKWTFFSLLIWMGNSETRLMECGVRQLGQTRYHVLTRFGPQINCPVARNNW